MVTSEERYPIQDHELVHGWVQLRYIQANATKVRVVHVLHG
jgi:hypothetical protein